MKIDVFLCTCAEPDDRIRWYLYNAVRSRWLVDSDRDVIRFITVTPQTVGCTRRDFQGLRRTYAEQEAASDVYITADDDCMPLGVKFLEKGVNLMDRYSDYTVLAASFLGADVSVTRNDEIIDIPGRGTGGINFIRKGALGKFLPTREKGGLYDDAALTADIRMNGLKCGNMRDVQTNHLGTGLSTIWPVSYQGKTQLY